MWQVFLKVSSNYRPGDRDYFLPAGYQLVEYALLNLSDVLLCGAAFRCRGSISMAMLNADYVMGFGL